MTPMPPPFGIPNASPMFHSFDAPTLVVIWTACVLVGALIVLLWARRAHRATYVIRCPRENMAAIVVLRTDRRSGRLAVERCSLCQPSHRVDCGQRCLRLVA